VIPGRNKALLSAARIVAKELRNANPPAGRLEAVPAKGIVGGERRGRALGLVVRYGLWLSVACSALAFFLPAADRLGDGKGALELVVGVVLTIEGLLLVSNWHGARWRLVRRWVERQGGAPGMLDALRWRLIGYALFLVGLVWVAVGVIELGQGTIDLL
jgi:hypothetical protein